jgi:flagellin
VVVFCPTAVLAREVEMGLAINSRVAAMNIWRNLDKSSILLASSMEKLSSGLRINRASDDPAGLVISEQMRSRIASLNQEIENTSIAISKYETADSAVMQLRDNLTQIRSLAVGAANSGINDDTIRAAYQSEADCLVQSYNKIVSEASFGTQKLLDGSAGSLANIAQLKEYDLSSEQGIEDAIKAVDEEAGRLDMVLSDIGATQKNDLESRLANLRIESENLTAAESQIRDTDYITEYSNFLRNKLVVQAAMSLLSHNYISAQSVLTLLRG